ncbi:MAG: hypothetical protein V3S31_08245 [Dehalococcoidia bacterium]
MRSWWRRLRDWASQLAIARWLDAPTVAGRPFRWGDNATLLLLAVGTVLGVGVTRVVLLNELPLLLVVFLPIVIIGRVLLRRGLAERFGTDRRILIRFSVIALALGSGLVMSRVFSLFT